ncbi:MAG TPA: SPFH domain-containing protein [Candidatus Paceibacterota bacterium]
MNAFYSKLVIATGLAIVVFVVVWMFQVLCLKFFQTATGKSAPKQTFGPFSNWITRTMLAICVGLMMLGVCIVLTYHSYTGVLVSLTGYIIWWAGDKDIPTEPQHAGTLMLQGDYILTTVTKVDKNGTTTGEKQPIVVGGRTIVFPYWPFYLSVKTFDMTLQDYEIDAIIYCMDSSGNRDNLVPVYGKISVAIRPDRTKLIEYNLAGGMKNIKAQVDDIVIREVRHIATRFTIREVVTDPTKLTRAFARNGEIRERVERQFEGNSFGIDLVKLQPDFNLSEELREEMEQHQAEIFQRFAELEEIETDIKAAERLLASHRHHGNDDITFKDCLEQYKLLKVIRQGKTYKVDSKGGTLLPLGGGGGKKKKNNQGNN